MTSHMTDMFCNDNTSKHGVIGLLVVFNTIVVGCHTEITNITVMQVLQGEAPMVVGDKMTVLS